jgi:hypothetical protein
VCANRLEAPALVQDAEASGKGVKFMKIVNAKVMVTSPDRNFGTLEIFTNDTVHPY